MSLSERVLCVNFTNDGPAAQIALKHGALTYLAGSPGAHEAVRPILQEIERAGVHVPVERHGSSRLEVDAVKVSVEHPRYLTAVAHAFRDKGWRAHALDRDRAEVWHDLIRLPLDHESKEDLFRRLVLVEGEALAELRDLLARAVKELSAASR